MYKVAPFEAQVVINVRHNTVWFACTYLAVYRFVISRHNSA